MVEIPEEVTPVILGSDGSPARLDVRSDHANAPTNPARGLTDGGHRETAEGLRGSTMDDAGKAAEDHAPDVFDARDVPSAIGRYRVLGRIATGGMADILLGKLNGPSGFQRAVVIKSILPHLARDEEFVGMFLDEARLTAQIRHPNVVQVHELGRDGALLYLVMEYLDGESCNSILREAARRGTHPPHALAAHICAHVAAGLHAAHVLTDDDGKLLGVVHRDVSPQNVLVTYDGQVKLLDFGIAKAAGRTTEGTRAGQIKGKFAYMAPEQATRAEVDARTDVFSLGVVLWEMTTGRRLFKRASELMVLRALSEEPIPRPSDQVKRYPPLLESIVMRALARDPKDRFQTALDLRQALAGWLRDTDSDDTVEHQLASYMADRFSDRAQVKRGMLSRAVEVESFEELDISVVHESSIEMASNEGMFDLPVMPRAPRRIWPAALGAVGLVVLAVLVPRLWRSPASAPVAAIVAPAPGPPSTNVTLHLDSEPRGAALKIDGAYRGKTPLDIVRVRDAAVALELSYPGYVAVRETRTLKSDLELHLTLQKVAQPSRTSHAPARPPRRKNADPFHRFE